MKWQIGLHGSTITVEAIRAECCPYSLALTGDKGQVVATFASGYWQWCVAESIMMLDEAEDTSE